MQHNLTSSALALIPFSLAAASNPSTIRSVIIIWGGGTAGGGWRGGRAGNLWTLSVYKALYFKGRTLKIQPACVSVQPLIKYLIAAHA